MACVLVFMSTRACADVVAEGVTPVVSAKRLRAIDGGALDVPVGAVDPLPGMSDEELDARSQLLERAITRNAHDTRLWQGFFVTMYGAGLVVEAARAAVEIEPASRADYTIGAIKAAIGVAGRMARAPRAVYGPKPDELVPGSDRTSRARRLLVAESMLSADAKDCDRRYAWQSHTFNVGLNVIGGLIVALAYHDWARALESSGTGIAIGELSIWTQPWKAKREWKRYVRTYGPVRSAAAEVPPEPVHPRPMPGAVELVGITF